MHYQKQYDLKFDLIIIKSEFILNLLIFSESFLKSNK